MRGYGTTPRGMDHLAAQYYIVKEVKELNEFNERKELNEFNERAICAAGEES